jgi:hypothetical protein
MYTIFVSHAAEQTEFASAIARSLAYQNLDGFVASRDLVQGLPWEASIEQALSTCDALVACLTPDFRKSQWCDQEVGIALGRGVPVVPVQLGDQDKLPHGFMARYQAVQATGREVNHVAAMIFDALYACASNKQLLTACILKGLLKERSLDLVRRWAERLAAASGALASSFYA